jgi:hypothetical protein
MRILGIALVLALATAAWAQDRGSATLLGDNPKIFMQPEEPAWPEPVPVQQIAPAEQQVAPAPEPETRQNVGGREETGPAAERQNVGGRDENDQEQHLFDQWNAPSQTKGGTASVRIVR